MNELLQRHGCANVFTVPEGLKELMSDITREPLEHSVLDLHCWRWAFQNIYLENLAYTRHAGQTAWRGFDVNFYDNLLTIQQVLREQPNQTYEFIANYLSALLITREHGILAVKILEDLCDCRPTVSEHLMQLGLKQDEADDIAKVIQDEIEGFEPIDGQEKLKEAVVIKKILKRIVLNEETTAQVCQVCRNAYKEYWYRKKLLEQNLPRKEPVEPWQKAAENTLELYKRTKPSYTELTRATVRIQAAYRGYYIRKKMLQKRSIKPKNPGPKMGLLGTPIDIAESREIDLGPLVNVTVRQDEVISMFASHAGKDLGLNYDPNADITDIEDKRNINSPTGTNFTDGSLKTSPKKGQNKRTQSFALEVLGINKEDCEGIQKNYQDISSSSSDMTISRQYPSAKASLIKKISFAGDGPEIIPVNDVDDDIAEELPIYRSDGDGNSASSISSDQLTADDGSDIDDDVVVTFGNTGYKH